MDSLALVLNLSGPEFAVYPIIPLTPPPIPSQIPKRVNERTKIGGQQKGGRKEVPQQTLTLLPFVPIGEGV